VTIDQQTFYAMDMANVAKLVQSQGPKVCAFPSNGTRRWFALEHPEEARAGNSGSYLRITGLRHIELYKLFFDHGVHTLVAPIFGPDLLERGEEYRHTMVDALLQFAQDRAFVDFYDTYDVRVKVYGDTTSFLADTPFAPALAAYKELAARTADHQRHRLFFGVCAHDPTEALVTFGHHFFEANGRVPAKREIIEAYYGEYVEPLDLFIGFDRPAVFDIPLIATGEEDLYFTVSPSPYLDKTTLRSILYDHMFSRRVGDRYDSFSEDDWQTMDAFYKVNRHGVLGVGRAHKQSKFWYPTQQVEDVSGVM